MNSVITIDTGTTNTRVTLWQQGQALANAFEAVGVRNTAISGSVLQLQKAVKHAIDTVLAAKNIQDHTDVLAIASGMITSNLGLVEIPHVTVPAGVNELAAGMQKVIIPEVFDQPIWFIPGVKNDDRKLTVEKIADMDVVRGEEVEAMAAIKALNIHASALIILPGSHTKIMKLNAQGQIVGSITSMTGELLDLLTKKSILADSVDKDFVHELERKSLLLGARAAEKNGIGRAAFSVRLLGMYSDLTRNQRANYLLGVVLANDLLALKNTTAFPVSSDEQIIILGKAGLRDALKLLIEEDSALTDKVLVDDVPNLAGKGALEIAEKRHLLTLTGEK